MLSKGYKLEIERRERDLDTGEINGGGFSDVLGKIAAKLTGKTASKLASKAAEKLVEKGAEKVGEKTGQLLGEKIYDKFSAKQSEETPVKPTTETKGKEIGEMLKKASSPSSPPEKNKFQEIKDLYDDLL